MTYDKKIPNPFNEQYEMRRGGDNRKWVPIKQVEIHKSTVPGSIKASVCDVSDDDLFTFFDDSDEGLYSAPEPLAQPSHSSNSLNHGMDNYKNKSKLSTHSSRHPLGYTQSERESISPLSAHVRFAEPIQQVLPSRGGTKPVKSTQTTDPDPLGIYYPKSVSSKYSGHTYAPFVETVPPRRKRTENPAVISPGGRRKSLSPLNQHPPEDFNAPPTGSDQYDGQYPPSFRQIFHRVKQIYYNGPDADTKKAMTKYKHYQAEQKAKKEEIDQFQKYERPREVPPTSVQAQKSAWNSHPGRQPERNVHNTYSARDRTSPSTATSNKSVHKSPTTLTVPFYASASVKHDARPREYDYSKPLPEVPIIASPVPPRSRYRGDFGPSQTKGAYIHHHKNKELPLPPVPPPVPSNRSKPQPPTRPKIEQVSYSSSTINSTTKKVEKGSSNWFTRPIKYKPSSGKYKHKQPISPRTALKSKISKPIIPASPIVPPSPTLPARLVAPRAVPPPLPPFPVHHKSEVKDSGNETKPKKSFELRPGKIFHFSGWTGNGGDEGNDGEVNENEGRWSLDWGRKRRDSDASFGCVGVEEEYHNAQDGDARGREWYPDALFSVHGSRNGDDWFDRRVEKVGHGMGRNERWRNRGTGFYTDLDDVYDSYSTNPATMSRF